MDVSFRVHYRRSSSTLILHCPVVTYSSRIFSLLIGKFDIKVKEVVFMRLIHLTRYFIEVFRVFHPTKKSTWEGKMKFYKEWVGQKMNSGQLSHGFSWRKE